MLKLMMIGNLTRDPELRIANTENGQRSVTNFTVAVNGRREGEATYVRVSTWDGLAENCAKYLAKGRKVFCLCSSISARTYQANDGTSRISLEATANEVEFLSSAGERTDAPRQSAPATAPAPARPPVQESMMTPVDFSDEELPF